MERDPVRMCELLVGSGDVEVLGVADGAGRPLGVHVRRHAGRLPCSGCGGRLWCSGERRVVLVDLPVFRLVRLVWHKRRWVCPHSGCETRSVTEQAEKGHPRHSELVEWLPPGWNPAHFDPLETSRHLQQPRLTSGN